MNGIPKIPTPINEPVLSYASGTPERGELKRAVKDLSGRQPEIPLVIGGKDVHTGRTVDVADSGVGVNAHQCTNAPEFHDATTLRC